MNFKLDLPFERRWAITLFDFHGIEHKIAEELNVSEKWWKVVVLPRITLSLGIIWKELIFEFMPFPKIFPKNSKTYLFNLFIKIEVKKIVCLNLVEYVKARTSYFSNHFRETSKFVQDSFGKAFIISLNHSHLLYVLWMRRVFININQFCLHNSLLRSISVKVFSRNRKWKAEKLVSSTEVYVFRTR